LILEKRTRGESVSYADYRNIDGEVVPFRMTIQDSLGESTIELRRVVFDEDLPEGAFAPSTAVPGK
jgi:hypothetical protein